MTTIARWVVSGAAAALLAMHSPKLAAQDLDPCAAKTGHACVAFSRDQLAEYALTQAVDAFDGERWADMRKALQYAQALRPDPLAELGIARAEFELGLRDAANARLAQIADSENPEAAALAREMIDEFVGRTSQASENETGVDREEHETTRSDDGVSAVAMVATLPQPDSASAQALIDSPPTVPRAAWTTGVFATAFAGTATGLGILSNSHLERARRYDLTAPGASLDERDARLADARSFAVGSNVAWVASAAMAGATIAILSMRSRGTLRSRRPMRPEAPASGARLLW